jgi:hypothetical protein
VLDDLGVLSENVLSAAMHTKAVYAILLSISHASGTAYSLVQIMTRMAASHTPNTRTLTLLSCGPSKKYRLTVFYVPYHPKDTHWFENSVNLLEGL